MAALVASGEISRSNVPELFPSPPARAGETAVADPSSFPESPLPPAKWSAEDVLIRADESSLGAASAMRKYQSRFESIGAGGKGAKESKGTAGEDVSVDFDAVLRAADECCRELRLKHPALLEEFALEFLPKAKNHE